MKSLLSEIDTVAPNLNVRILKLWNLAVCFVFQSTLSIVTQSQGKGRLNHHFHPTSHKGMEGKIIQSPMAITCKAIKGTAELITSPIVY